MKNQSDKQKMKKKSPAKKSGKRGSASVEGKTELKARAPMEPVIGVVKTGPNGIIEIQEPGMALIETMAAEGQDLGSIAKALRISYSTFKEIRKRQPEVEEAIERGKAALADELTHILLTHARAGNVTSAIFLAKARLGWRDIGEATATTPKNTNITIILPDSKSPEEYAKMIDITPQPQSLGQGEASE